MLDLNHPNSKWIFAAAKADDAILEIAKKMTLLTGRQRTEYVSRADPYFEDLAKAADALGRSKDFEPILDSYRNSLNGLALLSTRGPTQEKRANQQCPVCSASPEGSHTEHDAPHCPSCLDYIQRAREDVDEFYGLWCI